MVLPYDAHLLLWYIPYACIILNGTISVPVNKVCTNLTSRLGFECGLPPGRTIQQHCMRIPVQTSPVQSSPVQSSPVTNKQNQQETSRHSAAAAGSSNHPHYLITHTQYNNRLTHKIVVPFSD